MIKEFSRLTGEAAREVYGALPREDQGERGCKCRLLLIDLIRPGEFGANTLSVNKEILNIATEIMKKHSKEALALLLAYDIAGNAVMVASNEREDVAAAAADELKRLTLELTDFDAALRVLRASKNPRVHQKAREAATGARIAAARPARRKLPL